jgi:Tfp pilus assembly protein PilO
MTLLKRILVEKRTIVIPLAIAVLANLAAYALIVYPLGVKSAGAVERAATAASSRRAAEQDVNAARALVTGKARAQQELATFFDNVLPADQTAAVRMTYSPLHQMAKKANMRIAELRYEPDSQTAKDARVTRLVIHVSMLGDYESIRQFLYEIERAPEFVIVDNITLTQGDQTKPPMLALDLSSYFRLDKAARHGT